MSVPLVDLAAQQQEVDAEVRAGLDEVFATTAFIGGKPVTEFEQRYAEATDVAYCVGVANGTDALELALRGSGVTAGTEVVLPANTFIATAEAVSRIGATPVLVDVDPEHLLIDPDLVAAVTSRLTRAIVPVHLFGQVAPVERLLDLAESAGAAVVEDAAQSQGATRFGRYAGSLGRAAGTSFYPGKNLGAAGDAGAVTTNSAEVAEQVRLIANHGSARKYHHDVIGINSRLDTLQAVVLQAKLKRLTAWNARRRELAARYTELLADLDGVRTPVSAPGNEDVWHLYVVRVAERDRVLDELHRAGIGAGIHYPVPVHLTEAYRYLGYKPGAFPVAERAAGEILSLPIYPHLTEQQQDWVIDALRKAVIRAQ
ncbi:dTDP-4-amino-4,6-dideoxygalactose transaminase [Friedmanniella endophytica]|uniref:dTDP-4-amino-4,6-dideoxygalactose transaminase n=1 Tax=Microlunatus kandeliicorticis TaxID=1759536 RepID=A0A7W3P4E0_9ACTN|nr:DegT/DnrJ/EryC1/StrS family aminotransferase [Microlunatus kandeliicorticis]MBA8792705.1 dTDP-4-amino-4,6-dideoxygalactose transaminase [Microlunatus kandeliicorticis]